MAVAEITHTYIPRGILKTAYECRDPEVLVSGPAGTGKSRALLERVLRICLHNDGVRALLVRKTLVSLTSTGLVTWREHVAREAIEAGLCQYYGGSRVEPAAYRFHNGSTVAIGGMDKAEKIMSSEYDIVFVQEATDLEESDWEAITTRLRNRKISFQQVIADCNPSYPTHWLYQRTIKGQTTVFESRHEDNPTLFNEDGSMTASGADYMAKLDSLTGVRHARLRRGLWVAAEGLVYEDEYDPSIHLINSFTVPRHWKRYWSIDFGYTNPFVCQFWAEDPDGRLYLYREIYRSKRIVADHVQTIKRYVQDERGNWTEPVPQRVIADHDAEDRATFEREMGLGTQPARKTVSDGIQAVQTRLKRAGDGKARIFLMRDALVDRDQELADAKRPTSSIEEIGGYIWDIKPGKAPKEEPLKIDDHGMDAMRYMVAELDLVGGYRMRWL